MVIDKSKLTRIQPPNFVFFETIIPRNKTIEMHTKCMIITSKKKHTRISILYIVVIHKIRRTVQSINDES
jgi:hypothetical protein